MLEQGTVLQGRYEIVGKLGQGGMGEVYQARHLKLGIPVAIKTLLLGDGIPGSTERREQFEQEGRILASLSHSSVARVTDFFEEGSTGYLALEYIDGKPLEGVVRDRGALDEPVALEWTFQLLDALAYLHACTPPVIVRDLKPSNVMVGTDGRVRLIDFGIAKILHAGEQTRTVARAATSEGYAPLEQYGVGGTDQRSDLYSLGATMLFMLTGQHPPDAVSRVTQGVPLINPMTANATVSAVTWNTIQKLMAISQSDRPVSTTEARSLLLPDRACRGDVVTGHGISNPPPENGMPCGLASSAIPALPARTLREPASVVGTTRTLDGPAGTTPLPASPPTVVAEGAATSTPPPGIAVHRSRRSTDWRGTGASQAAQSRHRVLVLVLATLLGLGALLVYQGHRATVRERERIQAEETRQAEAARLKAEEGVRAEKARQEEAARVKAEGEARAAEAERAYQADAQKALEALARLDARTDIGVNYRDYKEVLGGVHYVVKEFTAKYEVRAEGQRNSYRYIAESNQRFYAAGEAWRLKIEADADEFEVRMKAEAAVQANWKMASTLIADARKALERRN